MALWPLAYGFLSSLFPSWHTYKSKYKLNSILIPPMVQYYILDSFHCFLPHIYLPQLTVGFTLVFPVGRKQVSNIKLLFLQTSSGQLAFLSLHREISLHKQKVFFLDNILKDVSTRNCEVFPALMTYMASSIMMIQTLLPLIKLISLPQFLCKEHLLSLWPTQPFVASVRVIFCFYPHLLHIFYPINFK